MSVVVRGRPRAGKFQYSMWNGDMLIAVNHLDNFYAIANSHLVCYYYVRAFN